MYVIFSYICALLFTRSTCHRIERRAEKGIKSTRLILVWNWYLCNRQRIEERQNLARRSLNSACGYRQHTAMHFTRRSNAFYFLIFLLLTTSVYAYMRQARTRCPRQSITSIPVCDRYFNLSIPKE